ncbi:hypothetical protein N7450_009088 [Penicillium hetheringtonii]|uniref:Uncharacterized protein n=1 Tax=Penicillium hetheringtonii TaxID=911720 RepID=A0AAD6GQC3_9EURO|nr:hypothetical protein N7450_009088 [Penicillium hetheringtonii]
MSIILHSPGPQSNFKKGAHWYHESPFLPFCWEDRHELGAPSLKHAARQKSLEDQSALKPEMFESIPWPIALELWEYLGRCKKQTLFMWKIMAASYPREFRKVSRYYCLWTARPMEPLKGYIDIMNSEDCNWRAILSLSTGYATMEDLVSIGNLKNLVALELSKSQWQPSKYSPETHQPANEIENGVIHTWVDWARTTGSLQHLRVLRLYHQSLIKPSILQLLTELPNLQLIIIYQCQHFSEEFCRAKKPYSGRFEMQGWNVLRLDWALENTIEEEQTMQPLGPLLDVYRSTLNNRGTFSSTETHTQSSALGPDVPIMEFGLPASDHSDRSVEIRAQYASKLIAILTRVPVSNKKRLSPPQGNSNKSGKRIMKDKGARDMTDLLNDFL